MKTKLFFLTAVLLINNYCSANPTEFRKFTNRHGSYVGSQTTLKNGNIIYRDRSGRAIGYGTRNNPRSTLYSNSHGSYMFRETYQNVGRNSTFYNRAGKPIGHSTNQNARGRH